MLVHLKNAIFRPARRPARVHPIRSVIGLPVIFDLVSLAFQLRDLRRVRSIRAEYGPGGKHHARVQDYNADVTQTKLITTTRRAEVYYRALVLPLGDPSNARLLLVGPRNIHEFLIAWIMGFSWNKMIGIDLYSTSKKITVMNMESMTFRNGSFDAVCMANTLSYSDNTENTISEVSRVISPGGYFSFSATHDPGSSWHGDLISGEKVAEILEAHAFELIVHDHFEKTNSQGRRQTSHTFVARRLQTLSAAAKD